MSGIAERLINVRADIELATEAAKRPAGAVQLVAVSKFMGAEIIAEALEAGQRIFGENYVQETQDKWPQLRERFSGVDLHMIGPLQSNKAAQAVRLFDVIETLDRESLAKELVKAIDKEGRSPRLLVQVNIGEEAQKGGVLPLDVDRFIESLREHHKLVIEGLMCIPPADEPAAPYFALLTTMARRQGLATLSMGMSADYRDAIRCGATHVRVGTAIFGARPTNV